MDLKQKIKLLLANTNVTAEELCKKIGMSNANLQFIYKRNSIETKHLIKIANELKVPITYFFDESNEVPEAKNDSAEIELLKKEIEMLNKKVIELQDELLQLHRNKK